MVDFLIYSALMLTWFFIGRWSVTSMLPKPEEKKEIDWQEVAPVDVGEDEAIAQGEPWFRHAQPDEEDGEE
jgi:hypothetical protein